MTERTEILIGKNNINKLNNSHIAVFGVGGVGGYVAEMLVRAGVGTITLVDFDVIDKTNLNRQIIALNSTIGMKKVDALKNRLLDINPQLIVNTIDRKYLPENNSEFFNNRYDYVIDAIDMMKSKVDLIKYCLNHNINIVSAMGAGNRYDLPVFQITDIFKTYNDGLAKVLRKQLRDEGIEHLDVCFTDSKTVPSGDTIGSISYYPAMCGCTIAGYVINKILERE